jgi:hypothetical protein
MVGSGSVTATTEEEEEEERAQTPSSSTVDLACEFRARLKGKPLVLIGDSIADDFARFLVAMGIDVRADKRRPKSGGLTSRGTVPSEISQYATKYLRLSGNENVLQQCGGLAVCAGKNLHRSLATIPNEVQSHLLAPLARRMPVGVPSIYVGPITQTQLRGIDSCGGEKQQPTQASPPNASSYQRGPAATKPPDGGRKRTRRALQDEGRSLLDQVNEQLGLAAAAHAFKFVNLVEQDASDRLCVDDYLDDLHLTDRGNEKMARALLRAW